MKTCSRCTRSLPPESFHPNSARKDGLSVYCRECQNTYALGRYHAALVQKQCRCGAIFTGRKNSRWCGKCPRPKKPITGYRHCKRCDTEFPYRVSLKAHGQRGIAPVNQKFCSLKCALMYRNTSLEMREHLRAIFTGRKLSPEWKENMKRALTGRAVLSIRGPKHHFWKGGITEPNKKIRASLDLKEWRRAVFARDDFTCQFCFERGGKLNAHHQLPFIAFPGQRNVVANGATLCNPCHRTIPPNLTSPFSSKGVH